MERIDGRGDQVVGALATDVGAPVAGRDAPRSGAAARDGASPFLDKEAGNVPRGAARPSWSRKQWGIRRAVIDRLRYWQWHRYQCLWATLTSAPASSSARLRRDFQVLRKRIARELGYETVEYVCVDTREGHGVLHMIWAWRDPNPLKRYTFYIPFDWLQAQWREIHGAFHVNVKRIGADDCDARRLSRYIVAQYCGGQNALVRLSQSTMEYPLSKMREALLRTVKTMPERYVCANAFVQLVGPEIFDEYFRSWFWREFRNAWDEFVRSRSCTIFGVQLVWLNGRVERV